MENKNRFEGMDDEAKAFILDAERVERIHQRELAMKNRTPEQIEADRLVEEQGKDLNLVVMGKMSKEEYKAKWNIN